MLADASEGPCLFNATETLNFTISKRAVEFLARLVVEHH